MKRPRKVRGWMMVWALLHFAMPTTAVLADARLERASATAQAHVEDASGTACAPVHEAECALCSGVHRAAPPAPEGGGIVSAVRQLYAHAPLSTLAVAGHGEERPPTRAPPVV